MATYKKYVAEFEDKATFIFPHVISLSLSLTKTHPHTHTLLLLALYSVFIVTFVSMYRVNKLILNLKFNKL